MTKFSDQGGSQNGRDKFRRIEEHLTIVILGWPNLQQPFAKALPLEAEEGGGSQSTTQ